MVYPVRFELTTTSFGGKYSIQLSYGYKRADLSASGGGYRGRTC